jgi:hypothetical protein
VRARAHKQKPFTPTSLVWAEAQHYFDELKDFYDNEAMSEPTDASAISDSPEGILQRLRSSKAANELRRFMATEIGLSSSPRADEAGDEAFGTDDAGDGDGE